jgi:hypothetical protein
MNRDRKNKITMIMAMGGATQEHASTALECGGNVRAMERQYGSDNKEEDGSSQCDTSDGSYSESGSSSIDIDNGIDGDKLDTVKQGQKCCGVCCDFRRAVVICNVLMIIFELVILVFLVTGILDKYYVALESEMNTTVLMDKYERLQILLCGISVLLSSIAIVGALCYNTILVGINGLWLLVEYILGIALVLLSCNDYCQDYIVELENRTATDPLFIPYCTCSLSIPLMIASGVAICLWIYPHVGFIVQVHKGVMSRETYPREKYACCCV